MIQEQRRSPDLVRRCCNRTVLVIVNLPKDPCRNNENGHNCPMTLSSQIFGANGSILKFRHTENVV